MLYAARTMGKPGMKRPLPDPARALAALQRTRDVYAPASATGKLRLLRMLARATLRSARQLRRLHESLCFLRAYPDDARVLAQVEAMLARFDRRADLRAQRAALAHTGIAGTETGYPFFWPTALWLARCWPARLRLDRSDALAGDNIARALPILVTALEAAALKESALPGYEAIDRLRGRMSDAVFLIERIAAMPGDTFTREAFYDGINPSCTLAAGRDTPSRTREKLAGAPVAVDQKQIAAGAAHHRLHHAEHRIGGDRRIHRRAAQLQHAHARLRRQRVARRYHAVLAVDHRS